MVVTAAEGVEEIQNERPARWRGRAAFEPRCRPPRRRVEHRRVGPLGSRVLSLGPLPRRLPPWAARGRHACVAAVSCIVLKALRARTRGAIRASPRRSSNFDGDGA